MIGEQFPRLTEKVVQEPLVRRRRDEARRERLGGVRLQLAHDAILTAAGRPAASPPSGPGAFGSEGRFMRCSSR